ncbi:EAL domain-containing protein [Rossellomorea vietnamensis]|uniref:EAL domain-containing protein n=1 Tax=Rossellomorea vietnamensis TaxID=218284 RepID=A0A5D4M814_9BACI|nr:EAL domain-containing protein [Rossellomorea vietnamensis]TYR97628.1 EAL domain-containing protein [Rossellomorea vietnamensis]
MENTCINCGISIPFYERGFLTVQGETGVNIGSLSFSGEQTSTNTYQFSFREYYELMMMLQELERVVSGNSWRAGVSARRQNIRMIPFADLKNRMDKRDEVEFIQSGELVSYFQPIIELKNEELFGYESLLRSGDQEKDISPGALFQTADETGLHSFLDQRARETAIRCRKDHLQRGIKSFINFLPSTIYNPEFCLQHTFSYVEKYNVDPADLVFEVVETERIEDVEHLKKVFEVYRREGMKVALDDVGAGFSTLEMLSQLKPDYVKIDRSYIKDCDQNKGNQSFLKEAARISRELGISVLAEGIERKEELQYCQSVGIDLGQGFYIGRPMREPKVPVLV